jgi:hypothetical protein
VELAPRLFRKPAESADQGLRRKRIQCHVGVFGRIWSVQCCDVRHVWGGSERKRRQSDTQLGKDGLF